MSASLKELLAVKREVGTLASLLERHTERADDMQEELDGDVVRLEAKHDSDWKAFRYPSVGEWEEVSSFTVEFDRTGKLCGLSPSPAAVALWCEEDDLVYVIEAENILRHEVLEAVPA